MASSTSHLYQASVISIDEHANAARELLSANELYGVWNSTRHPMQERKAALQSSRTLTQRVLETLPNHPSALSLMARIHIDECHYDEAEKCLERASARDSDDENIALNHGYLLLAKRQYREAEQQFVRILSCHKNSHKAFSGVALAKLRSGDYIGAMNHFNRLIDLGYDTQQYRALLLDSMEFLSCDDYDEKLERLLLQAFSWPEVDHQKLANLAASQIIAKFDLRNEQSILDLDVLLSDELLLEAISKCLLTSVECESLIVEMRRAILTEVEMTETLRDALLPAAIAIGLYASRTDYILMLNADEERFIATLVNRVQQETTGKWEKDDLLGALITLSMYETLYSQPFTFKLLAFDLEDWPVGVQALLNSNLYEMSLEHQTYCELFGFEAVQVSNNDIRRASDRWQYLQHFNRTNYYQALKQEIGAEVLPERFATDTLNILLVGSSSGQRALHLAQYFENINVFAVDNCRENIAFATLKARKYALENVQFIHAEYDHALIWEHKFDIIEFGDAINHVADVRECIEEWQLQLQSDGLMRMSFSTHASCKGARVITQLVENRRLSPTADNIRHLRHAMLQESRSGLWSELYSDNRFYSGAGCRELFFKRHNHSFNLQELDTLLKTCRLSFLGFADMDEDQKSACGSRAPYSLLAWHVMDQDKALFKDSYEIYCSPTQEM